MDSHEFDMAQLCLEMAEGATGRERGILLDLADKWLAKAPRDHETESLAAEVRAMKHVATGRDQSGLVARRLRRNLTTH